MTEKLSTDAKALRMNVDAATYGTLAEIRAASRSRRRPPALHPQDAVRVTA